MRAAPAVAAWVLFREARDGRAAERHGRRRRRSGPPAAARGYEHRLSCWSERTYGLTAGLPRILGVLAAFDAPATFYVPGVTAERHPDEIAALSAAGTRSPITATHRFPNTLTGAGPAPRRSSRARPRFTAITGARAARLPRPGLGS